jgi:hypothetical protein
MNLTTAKTVYNAALAGGMMSFLMIILKYY